MKINIFALAVMLCGLTAAQSSVASEESDNLTNHGYTINLYDLDKVYCQRSKLPFDENLALLIRTVGSQNVVHQWLHDDSIDKNGVRIHTIAARGPFWGLFVYAPSMEACKARLSWAVQLYKLMNGIN